jgi:hypothetical protein
MGSGFDFEIVNQAALAFGFLARFNLSTQVKIGFQGQKVFSLSILQLLLFSL